MHQQLADDMKSTIFYFPVIIQEETRYRNPKERTRAKSHGMENFIYMKRLSSIRIHHPPRHSTAKLTLSVERILDPRDEEG